MEHRFIVLALLAVAVAACGGSSGLAGLGSKESEKDVSKKTVEKKADGDTAADETIVDASTASSVTGSYLVGCEAAPTEQAAVGDAATQVAFGCFVRDASGKKAAGRKIGAVTIKLVVGTVQTVELKTAADSSLYHTVFGLPPAVAAIVAEIGVTHTDLAGKDEKKVEHAEKHGAGVKPVAVEVDPAPVTCGEHEYRFEGITNGCEPAEELTVLKGKLDQFEIHRYVPRVSATDDAAAMPDAAASPTGIFVLPPTASACTAEDALTCLQIAPEYLPDFTTHVYEILLGSTDSMLANNYIYRTPREAALALQQSPGATLIRAIGRTLVNRQFETQPTISNCQFNVTPSTQVRHLRHVVVFGGTDPYSNDGWKCLVGLGYSIP